MENTFLLEGAISVKAALEAGRRPVLRILSDGRKPDRNRNYIFALAHGANVPIQTVSREQLDGITSGHSHGGLAAEVGERTYAKPEALFTAGHSFLALLDGVEDPYNFGDTLRSLYAAGATGVLIPKRNRFSAADIVTRASAGASEKIEIACVDEWDAALSAAKQQGYRILCAARKDASPLFDADLTGKILLVFGGALRGISARILRLSDQNLFLPYSGDFRNSLSGAAAAAVFAFEAMRQRRNAEK